MLAISSKFYLLRENFDPEIDWQQRLLKLLTKQSVTDGNKRTFLRMISAVKSMYLSACARRFAIGPLLLSASLCSIYLIGITGTAKGKASYECSPDHKASPAWFLSRHEERNLVENAPFQYSTSHPSFTQEKSLNNELCQQKLKAEIFQKLKYFKCAEE